MVSSSQKGLHTLLSANLKKLTITPPSASSPDFDFSEVFGPLTPPQQQQLRPITCFHVVSFRFLSGPTCYLQPFPLLRGESESEIKSEKKIGPGDFEILRVVGQGAFGKVFQVRKKVDRDDINGGDSDGDGDGDGDGIYAMKVMRKETIIKKNHVDYMKAERDILTKVMHPFIVQLRYSFQTKSKLYLILDFINGGHLFFHLYRQGIFSEDQARIYTAEIVSAVAHLHKCGIVHRDLKPENILMDVDGHPPFTHANRQKLQQRIINEKVKLPPFLTGEAHSLLKGLLQKDPTRRLGSGANGGDDIKRHKWFQSINWKKLEARELVPKFKPDVSGKRLYCKF
ncbi:hypothetical protein Patl1_17941 [Pistacia atlantica]|uniref:Uncharacterized protein n=1 Tax=Pistacia atlantica TaxID=434234 RepID=A0ACC1C0I2_9ROSI|nr:hypothetical protein Patl1_17941 [Pistacia atlantica]